MSVGRPAATMARTKAPQDMGGVALSRASPAAPGATGRSSQPFAGETALPTILAGRIVRDKACLACRLRVRMAACTIGPPLAGGRQDQQGAETIVPYRVLMIAPTSFFADYGCHVRILEEAL